ncbi:ABC transporter ATP-binding protein [Geobacter sulfurreducens]|nr:ABC transporter ATP-binding protein [Geobacter sulfurreducens]
MKAIKAINLTKTYRGKRWRTVEALKGLSLEIEQGEIFGFLGPNGAGKSTTIKTLLGLITPTAGEAWVCDVPISRSGARELIGYLPENPAFYDFLTAREYLRFVGKSFAMKDIDIVSMSDHVLSLLELTEAADRPIRSYSKGMVQRLGIAQTLIHDPTVFILDEPMSGLDPLGRALVKDIMLDLRKRGKTVFFSTHITADVETVCDRVGIIASGRLRSVRPVNDILESGVEGYSVRLASCPPELKNVIHVTERSDGMWDIYVDRNSFTELMAKIASFGVAVTLVEPKRKNLEAFFLETIEK